MKNVEIFFESDERYPDWDFSTDGEYPHHYSAIIDEKRVKRWRRIIAAYNQMQEEIQAIVDAEERKLGGW